MDNLRNTVNWARTWQVCRHFARRIWARPQPYLDSYLCNLCNYFGSKLDILVALRTEAHGFKSAELRLVHWLYLFVALEMPASIVTTMSSQDVVTRWRVSQLFYFIVSADRSSECQHMIECMFQGTLLEEPSLCISAFLGVAFNSSANAISGKPAIINGSVKICRVILLQGFFKQCLEDGWLNLPTPLNKETKHALVMASSYWLYWLRVPGQSFADLRSGVKLWQRCRLQQTLESKKAQLKNAQ